MSKVDNLTDYLTDLGNTIRTKKSKTDLINPQDFSDEISSIDTAKPEQAKVVTYTANGTYAVTPDEGYTLAGVRTTVNVSGKEEEEKTASYTDNGTYTISPTTGKVLSRVNVVVSVPKPQLFSPTVTVETPLPIIDITDKNGAFLQTFQMAIPQTGDIQTSADRLDLSTLLPGYNNYNISVRSVSANSAINDSEEVIVIVSYLPVTPIQSSTTYVCQPVYDAKGGVVGDCAIFFSGLTSSGGSANAIAYTKDFTVHNIMTTNNIVYHYPAVASTDKFIYVIGGEKTSSSGTTTYTSDVFFIDKDQSIYKDVIGTYLTNSRGAACKLSDNSIVVAGGKYSTGIRADVRKISNSGTVDILASLTTAVYDAMSGKVGNYALIAGGIGTSGGAETAVTAYSSSGTRTALGTPLGAGLAYSGCTNAGNNLVIAGGIDSNEDCVKDVYSYDSNLTQTLLTTLTNGARWDIGSATLNGTAVFIAGFDDSYQKPTYKYYGTDIVDMFDASLTNLSQDSYYFTKVGGVACVTLGNQIFTYGGRHNDGTTDTYINMTQGYILG